MEAADWTSMLYLAMRVLSAAMSTSVIRPLAASMFVFIVDMFWDAKRRRDIDAPLSERRVATFSRAWVNTPTETSDRLIASPTSEAAKEKIPLPPPPMGKGPRTTPLAAPLLNSEASKVDALMVRAERSMALPMLTFGPLEPSALTYTLTVLSRAMSLNLPSAPFAFEEYWANMVTPLNLTEFMS